MLKGWGTADARRSQAQQKFHHADGSLLAIDIESLKASE
jgi:hypothetical protein